MEKKMNIATLFGRLFKSVREYTKPSILSPVFVMGEVIMEILIPTLMAGIIDKGLQKGDMGYTVKMGLVMAAATMVSLFFGVMAGREAAVASSGFAKNLRADVFHDIQKFSFANIDKFSTGSLVTRLTTDITNVQNSYQMIIRIMVRAPFMMIMSLVMAIGINAKLSIIYMCVIPVLGVALYFMAKAAYPRFDKVFKTYDRLNTVVRENVTAMRVVKSYVRENHEEKKFTDTSKELYTQFKAAEMILAWNMPVMQAAIALCVVLVAWFSAKMIVGGTMTTGELMAMITYSIQILMSLMMVSMVFVMIVMAGNSAKRIVEVLDEDSTVADPEHPVTQVADGSIEFRNVCFSYSGDMGKLALANATLSIKSGEIIGILGGTGSGKTTMVQLISRLYDPTSGTVLVGGRDVREYGLHALRDKVAVVLQKNVLFSGTVEDNLRWGNENAADEEIVHACKIAQADGFIREMDKGYDTCIEQGGTNVSGGQKQRLCIARALLKKPAILILDDSTNAVDTTTDAMIRKAFREEVPEMTTLIISQRIVSVADADRIVVLNDGRIDGIGTSEDLLASNEIYKEIYDSQTGGEDLAASDEASDHNSVISHAFDGKPEKGGVK